MAIKMRIDKDRPIADGICFSDLRSCPPALRQLLMARGLVFLTEFDEAGARYGGDVIASSWEEADKIADARGLGERVMGVLAAIVERR